MNIVVNERLPKSKLYIMNPCNLLKLNILYLFRGAKRILISK